MTEETLQQIESRAAAATKGHNKYDMVMCTVIVETDIPNLCKEVRRLREEIEFLKTDKLRLDWLEKHAIDEHDNSRPLEFSLWDWSLRDAIDNGMRQRLERLAEQLKREESKQ